MQEPPFLYNVAGYIHRNYPQGTGSLCVILPSKRGALYLKQHLAKVYNKTIWLPQILSAEELIEGISGLQTLDSIDLVCELYEVYKDVYGERAERFDSFIKWGNLILQDFNEIDRYLVDAAALYDNLKDIKEIEHWSLGQEELSHYQKEYVYFMQTLGTIYRRFAEHLSSRGQAWQGLAYKTAAAKIEGSPFIDRYSQFLFCGFNALNKAEIRICSWLVKAGKGQMLWDMDAYYMDDPVQEAGVFLRRYFKNATFSPEYFKGDSFKNITKHIDIIGVPKGVGQAQIVSRKLRELIAEGKSLDKTAVVLAEENLLFPLLSQLPNEVQHVNITMEYPLRLTPLYDLVEQLLNLHHSISRPDSPRTSYYYADVLKVMHNRFFIKYYESQDPRVRLQDVIAKISDRNYAWLTPKLLQDLFGEDFSYIAALFQPWKNALTAVEAVLGILQHFNDSEVTASELTPIETEYLHVFTRNFFRVEDLCRQQGQYLESIAALRMLFRQILSEASVPFIGEPLKGLQIMGVLETRTLDFEQVIVVGVNENVLPSGRSANSFIPNDLKRYFGMPLYADKDAIYAYHFYRLLQRASDVTLTYNTEADTFGSGEKSRFITQLQYELPRYNPQTVIQHYIASSGQLPVNGRLYTEIAKSPEVLEPIRSKAIDPSEYGGLSPSSLILYKDCSLRFYFRYSAGIKEPEEVEETAESNTFGTILHGSLEALYTPYAGRVLTAADMKEALARRREVVEAHFREHFSQEEARFGKNYLQQSVLVIYTEKLLRHDLAFVEEHTPQNQFITILALEKELATELEIPMGAETLKVLVKGKTDRLDRLGNLVRVIDYKTSVSQHDRFDFIGFEALFSLPEYNKMFQLFMYAWLAVKNGIARPEELRPCIIPFKKFSKEPYSIKQERQPLVFSAEVLTEFEEHLVRMLRSVFDTTQPFASTPDETRCEYCAYASICNIG